MLAAFPIALTSAIKKIERASRMGKLPSQRARKKAADWRVEI